MNPEELQTGFYYGYVEQPYGYMMVKFLGINGNKYVFSVEMPKGPDNIELSEDEVRNKISKA